MSIPSRRGHALCLALLTFALATVGLGAVSAPARAAVTVGRALPAATPSPSPVAAAPATAGVPPVPAVSPVAPLPGAATPSASPSGATFSVNLGGTSGKPNQSLVIIIGLAILSIAPALLVLTTSFTKIIVVLSLTRNALGLQNVPPNQVLAGLALFLSLFLMGPVLSQVNHDGLQPYLSGTKTQQQAYDDGVAPLKTWMLKQTRRDDIGMLTAAAKTEKPATPQATPMATLVPAFVLSELRGAFIIGLVIFVPFLVIDLVVSSSLMSLGMMMVPPVLVSLPFKILMFVLVDGWALIIKSLLSSYH